MFCTHIRCLCYFIGKKSFILIPCTSSGNRDYLPIGYFDKKYISLLESGGSKDYKNLLKPFHLNPSNADFWKKGIKVIENFIDDLEKF